MKKILCEDIENVMWNNFSQMSKAKNTFYEDIIINIKAKEK
jgi:hypothetical protein